MCDEIALVETALSDVQEMMAQGGPEWRFEWVATVQTVLANNSGWGWQAFWQMVMHNLCSPSCAVSVPSADSASSLPLLLIFSSQPCRRSLVCGPAKSTSLCSCCPVLPTSTLAMTMPSSLSLPG